MPRTHLWMNRRLWIDQKTENGVPQPSREISTTSRGGKSPGKRDDPRQGGEEAEVVVYQPRGVGLIHTRLRPSDCHYTHGFAAQCK